MNTFSLLSNVSLKADVLSVEALSCTLNQHSCIISDGAFRPPASIQPLLSHSPSLHNDSQVNV